jgi:hypothetical protein
MHEFIRLTLLALFIGGLLALWVWSRRRTGGVFRRETRAQKTFQVSQKRWIDQRTGVCLVEAEGQSFLLAYTVGGGVSWQPVAAAHVEKAEDFATVAKKNGLLEGVRP